MKKIWILLCCIMYTASLLAQNSKIHADNVKSLSIVANEDALLPPVVNLGGRNIIDVDFDVYGHDEHRLIYKIEHCNADWTPSTEIFESDFLTGFNGQVIEDVCSSFNTNLLYTHYHVRIPNEHLSLKLSGNYRLQVFCDEDGANTEEPLLTACFSLVEPSVNINASISSNTDIDFNEAHQQLSFSLNYASLNVNDPIRELKTIVMQNRRTDNLVINPKPNIQKQNSLEYTHNRQLIFPAGNEFHKFEILGYNRANMNVEEISWHDPLYHVTLSEDRPQRNYIFEQDQNGAAVFRNEDDVDNATASDYSWVHFTLKSTERLPGKIYLSGNWTFNQLIPEYEMHYNETTKAYETSLLLKMGYYNYQYLYLPPESSLAENLIDGNFFQTENEYIIMVYRRPLGQRYDQLVGYRKMNYKGN